MFKGGMAAFTLQLFHRLEKKVSKGSWKVPCKWLKHQKEDATENPTNQLQLQASEGTGHPYISYVSLLTMSYPKAGLCCLNVGLAKGHKNVCEILTSFIRLWKSCYVDMHLLVHTHTQSKKLCC